MNLNLAVDGGSVEVADTAFSREYNEALVHQVVVAYMAGAVKVREPRKTALQSAAVARSLGVKKALVVLARVLRVHRFGVLVASRLRRSRRIIQPR